MSADIKRRGLMLVLSSPSGAGKTTLSRGLLDRDKKITLSVSATTRPRRSNEVHGTDYYFLKPDEFDTWLSQERFLEHATVFGHRYGTPADLVGGALESGRDVLFDIDWQGTQQLRKKMPGDLVSIFILPPSRDELERRLNVRAQDSGDIVAARMAKAADEMSHWEEYDYVLINNDITPALTKIQTILDAERLKRVRQSGMGDFVTALIKQ
jgi:guanylate kinase